MTLAPGALGSRTFASLRNHRNYRLYFVGQVVSVSGTWVQNVAQAWLVLQLTHSPAAVGLLAVCQFGPYAVLGVVGGAVSDRLDNRRTLMATQAAAMGLAVVLAVLALTGIAQVWEVDLIAAAYGTVVVLDTPARQAFTMQMVGREELPNAIALNSSLFNGSRIIGPGIGGLIIAGAGVGACFLVNALSYVAVLACLALMRPAELRAPDRRPSRALVHEIGEGLSYARRTPNVRLVLVMMALVATMAINFNVLLPVLASGTLQAGPEVYGVLSASFGAGALAGALLSASLGRADWRVVIASGAGIGVGELLLAPQRTLAAALILLVVTGASFSLFTSNCNATVQLETPDHLRGRVLSLYSYVFFGTAPLGGFLAGWFAERGGTELAFGVGGGTALLAAAIGAVVLQRRREVRRNAAGVLANQSRLSRWRRRGDARAPARRSRSHQRWRARVRWSLWVAPRGRSAGGRR